MVCPLQVASEEVRTFAISCPTGIRAARGSMDNRGGGATSGGAVAVAAAAAGQSAGPRRLRGRSPCLGTCDKGRALALAAAQLHNETNQSRAALCAQAGVRSPPNCDLSGARGRQGRQQGQGAPALLMRACWPLLCWGSDRLQGGLPPLPPHCWRRCTVHPAAQAARETSPSESLAPPTLAAPLAFRGAPRWLRAAHRWTTGG